MKFIILLGLAAFVSSNPVDDKPALQYFKQDELGESFKKYELPAGSGCDPEVGQCIAETHQLAHRCVTMMKTELGQQIAACEEKEEIATADKSWQEASFKWHQEMEKCLNGEEAPAEEAKADAKRMRRHGSDDEDDSEEHDHNDHPGQDHPEDDNKRRKRDVGHGDHDHDDDESSDDQPPTPAPADDDDDDKLKRKRRHDHSQDHDHDDESSEDQPPTPAPADDDDDDDDNLKKKRRHARPEEKAAAEGETAYANQEACWVDMRTKREACKTKATQCVKYAKCNGLGTEPTAAADLRWWKHMKSVREDKEEKNRAHMGALHGCLHKDHGTEQRTGLWHNGNNS